MSLTSLLGNIGNIFKTANCGKCEIIGVVPQSRGRKQIYKIKVRFIKTGYEKLTTLRQIRSNDGVYDPYFPRVAGVGYIGEGNFKTKDRRIYGLWLAMLTRAYKNKAYKNCSVSKRWHCFQNFAEDITQMDNWNTPGFELDKDLRVIGNKIYSRKTCSFVPQNINSILKRSSNKPYKDQWGYRAITTFHGKPTSIGTFSTKERAIQALRKERCKYIRREAKKLRNKLHPDVYATLRNITPEDFNQI